VYIPSLNYDFIYSRSSSVLVSILILYSLIVYFTPENTRLGSDDIAGIKKILIAILNK